MGWMTNKLWFDSQQWQEIIFFSERSRSALRPYEAPLNSLGIKRLGSEADHSPPLVSKLRMIGAIPSLTHMPSWPAEAQLYLLLDLPRLLVFLNFLKDSSI